MYIKREGYIHILPMNLWCEKYRPTDLHSIIIDPNNKILFHKLLQSKHIPNLILHGPPGTGKTTTIMNFIHQYQPYKKELVIHLNASDDRGIDIIRNKIAIFTNTNMLFEKDKKKFIVLDEVDYMTSIAQDTLYNIIQKTSQHHIVFFLICNYISKIKPQLQNECIKCRFYNLPPSSIYSFLESICKKENVQYTPSILHSIQKYYESDIRAMINYIQLYSDNLKEIKSVSEDIYKEMYQYIISSTNAHECIKYIYSMCNSLDIDCYTFLHFMSYYIIRHYDISESFNIILNYIHHDTTYNTDYENIQLFIHSLKEYTLIPLSSY